MIAHLLILLKLFFLKLKLFLKLIYLLEIIFEMIRKLREMILLKLQNCLKITLISHKIAVNSIFEFKNPLGTPSECLHVRVYVRESGTSSHGFASQILGPQDLLRKSFGGRKKTSFFGLFS